MSELWEVLKECHPTASENSVHRAATKAMGKADANHDCVLSFDEVGARIEMGVHALRLVCTRLVCTH